MTRRPVFELSVIFEAPIAIAAEPPEVPVVFTSAPFKARVSTYELFVCPDMVMETVSEFPVIPVLALEANHELSALPVMIAETTSEFTQGNS